MEKNILEAKCRYCGKVVYSMYEGQLKYNIQAHELSCPIKLKEELGIVKDQSSTFKEEKNG